MIKWLKNLFKKKDPKTWHVCLWNLSTGTPEYYDMSDKECDALNKTKLPDYMHLMSIHKIEKEWK